MMAYTCREICNQIDEYAPARLALEGDPIGLHTGSYDQKVSRLFMALELTPDVAREAADFNPQMIIVHHTPLFKPLKQLRDEGGHNQIILELIRRQISLYTAHTNLDCVRGGVNDVLAERLGLTEITILQARSQSDPDAGLGRVGVLSEPATLAEYAEFVKKALGARKVRYCGSKDRQVNKVAVCGGAGAFLMNEAASCGADAYITADVEHHEGIQAMELGLALIDGGHFATENPVISVLAAWLGDRMPELTIGVSKISGDPFCYVD